MKRNAINKVLFIRMDVRWVGVEVKLTHSRTHSLNFN
jgi:hypothetical protein